MFRRIIISIIISAFPFCSLSVFGQQSDSVKRDGNIPELKKNVDILSSILVEGLELNESPNPFGINQGRVDSVYLQGQGVILEIQTPLAKRRNRVGLSALANSIQGLPDQSNPFSAIRRAAISTPEGITPTNLGADALGDAYRKLLQEVRIIDFDAIINDSIRQANSAARSLRELGELDQTSFTDLRQELDSIKESMANRMEELKRIENHLVQKYASDHGQLEGAEEIDLKEGIEQMKAALEQLKGSAVDRAAALSAQYEVARLEYEQQWKASVEDLEGSLYALLCDYGATLKYLPEQEYLSIVLTDLGEGVEGNSRSDKIHVISKGDLSQCQSGDIEAGVLQQRSFSYIY